jgi:hypothetical protein
MHLSQCSPGEHSPGQIIAASGNDGTSSGPHVHITQRDKSEIKIPPHAGYVWWTIKGDKP